MRRTVLKDHPRVPMAPLVPFRTMFSKSKKTPRVSPVPTPEERDPTRLPKGAEAALWSIVETIPDPRNHLALTRDPTAEVRLSRRQIDAAMAADEPLVPWVPPAGIVIDPEITALAETFEVENRAELAGLVDPDAVIKPVAAVEPASPRSDGVRWSADTAEVRLPMLAGPYDLEAAEASVHALAPAAAPAPVEANPARFAKGA